MSRPSNRAAQPNIIWRVGMLPLMNSTSQVLLMTYSDVKRTNWLTSTLCNALETSARMATGLAVRRAKPILDVFESQFASVNTFASKRLDKLEEEFPILQLSIDEVAWHLRESLTLTLDNAQECLSEETVKLRARAGALVEEMWALISCQAAAFLNTGPGQLMAARGDGWLRWLGEMVDRHLPDSADDCILEDAGVCGFERDIPVEPGLYLRVQHLTLKVHSRLYQRVLLYSQRAQEVALTDILLLMELFDWLRASWAFSVLDRSFQSLLGLSVSVTGHLAGLQAMLLGCLSEAARIVSSAWSVGLSFGGHSFRLGLQLLSQLSELATLLVLFLINILNALLFDLEEEGEDSGTLDSESDESQDGRGRWGVGPRASDLPSCISEDDLRKLLEHAGSRRRSLVRGADPHDAYQPHYSPGPSQSRWEGAGRRRSSESWAVPPQVERSDPLPALRRASADQGQIPGRRASHGTQSRGYRPSSHHM